MYITMSALQVTIMTGSWGVFMHIADLETNTVQTPEVPTLTLRTSTAYAK